MPIRPDRRRHWLTALIALLAVLGIAGAILNEQVKEENDLNARVTAMTGGNIEHGQQLFQSYGCGACHMLRRIPQARGQIGPPLDGIASRAIIAGKLSNSPDNLQRWIADPQAVSPGTAMPRLGVTAPDARDLTAFLYTR